MQYPASHTDLISYKSTHPPIVNIVSTHVNTEPTWSGSLYNQYHKQLYDHRQLCIQQQTCFHCKIVQHEPIKKMYLLKDATIPIIFSQCYSNMDMNTSTLYSGMCPCMKSRVASTHDFQSCKQCCYQFTLWVDERCANSDRAQRLYFNASSNSV